MMNIAPEAFIGFLTLAGGLISVYTKFQSRMDQLELRIKAMEQQDTRIIEKLDAIQEDLTDIKIDIQNKQDRV